MKIIFFDKFVMTAESDQGITRTVRDLDITMKSFFPSLIAGTYELSAAPLRVKFLIKEIVIPTRTLILHTNRFSHLREGELILII